MASCIALLDEQYLYLEAFANAQSRLLNASSSFTAKPSRDDSSREVEKAVEHLDSCRQEVQQNLKRLFADAEFCKKHKSHMDLSLRIVQTIAKNPSWREISIPSHASGVLEANTIALVTLRASIGIIKEELQGI